ncbi:hypothetical protein CCZ37_17065 [Vibrio qinghaiensis]|uniref:DUF4062 domain-containing protein n=1 Tax=Vibrio qinghaiensis TaxID=2025808 RepID=A0A223N337_9VIBR|nr:DUF4062 domain-containing protein [Vibrio qinghaiensis]ASU24188.1 hypothetical protein CCZ37_17065 [Vibrio qinghaiensis]
MAVPKVFISSTCFDLGEVRDQMKRFVRSFGFDPVLSDHGGVFYHPDLHTHEACVHEVSNCQLFILVIGGRYGGKHISDKTKSITNAEYEAARQANIPVFTYVRNGVLNNHHIYRENKNSSFVADINYPAIDKQEDAKNIFNFIDDVRRSPVNNAFEGFDNFYDIESHLRKQWAGMFFEFLRTREVKSQIDATNHLLSGLKSSHTKLEDLVKSMYRSTAPDNVEESISEIETIALIRAFFHELIEFDGDIDIDVDELGNSSEFDVEKIAKVSPKGKKWDDYLVQTGLFEREDDAHIIFHTGSFGFLIEDGFHKQLELAYSKGLLKSTKEQREKVLKEFIK